MYNVTFLNDSLENNMTERGLAALEDRRQDFERFMNGHDEDTYQEFVEYGLSFERGEDEDGEEYYKYILSTGGPHEEVRFHNDRTIEFVLLDWNAGVGFDVTADEVFEWLRSFFVDAGMMMD